MILFIRYGSPSGGEGGGLVPVFTELTRNLFETGKTPALSQR